LTQELIVRLKTQLGKDTCVLGTGGSIHLINKYLKPRIKIVKELTLTGINLIYQNYKVKLKNT
jgi:pantothenate kinase type III